MCRSVTQRTPSRLWRSTSRRWGKFTVRTRRAFRGSVPETSSLETSWRLPVSADPLPFPPLVRALQVVLVVLDWEWPKEMTWRTRRYRMWDLTDVWSRTWWSFWFCSQFHSVLFVLHQKSAIKQSFVLCKTVVSVTCYNKFEYPLGPWSCQKPWFCTSSSFSLLSTPSQWRFFETPDTVYVCRYEKQSVCDTLWSYSFASPVLVCVGLMFLWIPTVVAPPEEKQTARPQNVLLWCLAYSLAPASSLEYLFDCV